MKQFTVTAQMLQCVDDYKRNASWQPELTDAMIDRVNPQDESDIEAAAGLRYHFPKLTDAQIQKVLTQWHKEMERSNR